jgi:D-glycero-D-manno-heptose 1,7-bisphosphate phosphatase
MAARAFVILDRDGTLIVDRHYLTDPGQVELLPGAVEGLTRLRALGLGLVVITNQSAVGRGWLSEAMLDEIHRRVQGLLAEQQLSVDGIYCCPHSPDAGCDCRKPRTGLLERAAEELEIDLSSSFVIGDKASDLELGRAVGATTILVQRAGDRRPGPALEEGADWVVEDLRAAAEFITGRLDPRRPV